jgi:hypothetical protein
MTVLARIIMAIIGYGMACIAASLVLTISSVDWMQIGAPPADLQWALSLITAWASIIIFFVGFLPAMLVIAIAEGLALRSAVIYGVIGAALALAMAYGLDFAGYIGAPEGDVAYNGEAFAAAGIAGGLVYWLVAGRRAGAWK